MKQFQPESIIRLITDESQYVAQQARHELEKNPQESLRYLGEHWPEFNQELREEVIDFVEDQGRVQLKESWNTFLVLKESSALQFGIEVLDAYPFASTQLDMDKILEDLAGEFVASGRPILALELVDFLVGSGRYSCLPDNKIFDTPIQKQFSHLLMTQSGTSFSLACLIILVAHKLGIELKLCYYNDRFLVQIKSNRAQLFVDPSKYGELWGVDRLRFLAHQSENPAQALASLEVMMEPYQVMDYMLKRWNTEAYESGDETLGKFLYELMDASKLFRLSGLFSSNAPRIFQPGEFVRHAQYSYRAVVVDWDTECQASQDWLRKNPGQKLKVEPWYKLLVDDGQRITYVPQSNLIPEVSTDLLKHPLVQYFFETCPERGYIRNGRLWPH